MIATFKTPNLVSNLKAALLAACTDETRAHLCCIRIELADGVARFVATNGHWLWVNEAHYAEIVGVDDKGKKVSGTSSATVHVSLSGVKAILKGLEKGKKAAAWDVELDTSGAVRQLGQSVAFKSLDVVFPPYAQVIPAVVVQGKDVMTYDPTYIADVMAAFSEVSSNPKSCGICVEPSGGAMDPVVVTSDTSTALAVLMPRRHSNKPSGAALVAKYRGEKSAIKAA